MDDNSVGMPESQETLDKLFSAAYEQLRRLAVQVRRRDRNATLNPTALVNEVWLKLARDGTAHAQSELHFKRTAARAMRQILIDSARRRMSQKRDWGVEVSSDLLGDVELREGIGRADLLALDKALNELSAVSARQATLVELRFFGGMNVAEIAAVLGVSEVTIMRDWRLARAWLEHLLRPSTGQH